jgi:perosamine synthetase
MIPLVDCKLTDIDKEYILKYMENRQNRFDRNYLREFEQSFSNYIGRKYCIAVNSGTSALHLSLLALGVSQGDEVITSTHTCIALLNAINYILAKPILVDCKYDVIKMDYNLIENQVIKKTNSKTKAIIVPHMFGVPAGINKIRATGIPMIEDSTLSLGSKFKDGFLIGSKGDISVFSFHSSKMISASVGGAILTDNEKFARKNQ